jgi:hypothetical protein
MIQSMARQVQKEIAQLIARGPQSRGRGSAPSVCEVRSMTHGEACRIRACIDCGAPGGQLLKTTKGENPGRLLRLCAACLRGGVWWCFGLVDRDPLPLEEVA